VFCQLKPTNGILLDKRHIAERLPRRPSGFSAFVHLAAVFTVDFAARPAVLGGRHSSKTAHPPRISSTPFWLLILLF
jgi:hypothetical protein